MQKYVQLQKLIGKKFHRWFHFEQTEDAIDMYMGTNRLLSVSYDDKFIIFDIHRFMDRSNMFVLQQCLPYGLLTEQRIDGLYINNQRWTKDTEYLVFNSLGDCLNPPKKSNHNKENRKNFNKFMLTWEKNLRIAGRMNAPPLKNIRKLPYFSFNVQEISDFLQHVACTDIVEYCRHSTYSASNNDVTQQDTDKHAIQSMRKHISKKAYIMFLEGKLPFIGELVNE